MITRDGKVLRITVAMTMETATALLESGIALLGEGEAHIDLAQVPDVDSAALGLMFEWMRHARKHKASIVFSNLPQSLVSLATLYGVLELIPQQPVRH